MISWHWILELDLEFGQHGSMAVFLASISSTRAALWPRKAELQEDKSVSNKVEKLQMQKRWGKRIRKMGKE
jgi:hypothetical protein